MKHLFIFLFVLTGLICLGQAKIRMSPVFSFTPVSASTAFSTVNFGDTVNLKVFVKNSGNLPFSGSLTIRAYRDTTGGVFCDSIGISQAILPNDSVPVLITFSPLPGPTAFKSAGNGNTIVVWPLITSGSGIEGDSVRPVIWVNGTNGIFEFETNPFKIYPNPALNNITIKTVQNKNYKIMVYDVFARKVKEVSFKEEIDISDLTSGSYWMVILSENKSYRVPFIKE